MVLSAGLLLNYRELAIIALMGGTALVVAVLFASFRLRLGIERRISPGRVVRGDPARADLSLAPGSGRRIRWDLTVRDRVGDGRVEWRLPRLAEAGAGTRLTYELPTRRRGAVQVGPVGLVRTDPLGLCRFERTAGEVTELWVLPRVHPLVPLSTGRRRDLEGPAHERASGTITFHSLREYVVGDDLRLVHWPSTARAGTLVVRDNVDPSQPRGTVVLDTRETSYTTPDGFEAAVDAAASVLVASTSRRFPVRLLTGGGLLVDAGSSRRAERELLDALTRVRWGSEHGVGALTRRLARDGGGVSLVVVTGREGRAEARQLAKTVSRRYERLAVVCLDPGAAPGVVLHSEVLDLVAPDAPAFAALWREVA